MANYLKSKLQGVILIMGEGVKRLFGNQANKNLLKV